VSHCIERVPQHKQRLRTEDLFSRQIVIVLLPDLKYLIPLQPKTTVVVILVQFFDTGSIIYNFADE
jgi:hypothetical protein